MKVKYYIMSIKEIFGTVYEVGNNKIIFMRNPIIDVEYGIEFRDIDNQIVEDEEVKEILSNFVFKDRK